MFTSAKSLASGSRREAMRSGTLILGKTRAVSGVLCLIAAFLLLGASAGHAAGDAAAGQTVYARCAGCHSTTPGQNKIGPSLAGVVGRKSGTEDGYSYSPAMKNANITWDNATLDKFLASPAGVVHGTKMFMNLPSRSDRRNVIAYLDTLK
jgi:cytochrome c